MDDHPVAAGGAPHATHGGWRRAVMGLVFGAGLGLVARLLLGPDDRPAGERVRGDRAST